MKEFLIFLLIADSWKQVKYVQCEKKDDRGRIVTCFMKNITSIDSPGCIISPRAETIGALYFDKNKKIRFLPDKAANAFPNLLFYSAWQCSLTEVFKSNFERLSNLTELSLHSNQIEKNSSDTFEDLTSLWNLILCKSFSRVI